MSPQQIAQSKTDDLGRAWRLSILTTPDAAGNQTQVVAYSTAWTPEPLKMSFDTYQTASSAFWYADIALYNLNDATTQQVIKQGMTVRLEAGYQTQPYGVIFEGTLFQPLWERENNTDYKLTLHCLVGLIESTNNFVALSVASGVSQRDIVARIAAAANNPLDSSNVGTLGTTKQSRGSVYFGQPHDYFKEITADQIIKGNYVNYWASSMAVNIQNLIQSTSAPTLSYGPGNGLVGTPQQTQDGVTLRIFLDPRAKVATQIKLAVSVAIKQLPRVQGDYPTILDQDGLYVIAGVRHWGDTRAQEWYSDITCYTYIGSRLALLNP